MPGRPYRSSGKDLQFRSDKPFKIAIAVVFISAIVWFGHHHPIIQKGDPPLRGPSGPHDPL